MPYRIFPIVSDATTRRMLASPTVKGPEKLIYYVRVLLEKLLRFAVVLFWAGRYDVVFFQRTSFPFGLERLIKKVNPNIIFDFDDSIFMSDPDSKELGWLGGLKDRMKASEVAGMVAASKLVVAGNDFLKEYADRFSDNAIVSTETIDTERYTVGPRRAAGPVRIGWIGSPSTSAYLEMLLPAWRSLAEKYDIQIRLIGAGDYRREGLAIVNVPWDFETEIGELHEFDIGVMPQPVSEWTEGKFGSKMLQYMAVGVPAVISYSRANSEVVADGVNGFLAKSQEEWISRLSLLIEDPALRERLGKAGRRTIESRFSLQARGPEFVALLESCLV